MAVFQNEALVPTHPIIAFTALPLTTSSPTSFPIIAPTIIASETQDVQEAMEVASAQSEDLVADERTESKIAIPLIVEAVRTPPASANYTIARSVLGSGGGLKTSTHYVLQGTSGQTTGVGQREGSHYVLQSGYWRGWTTAVFPKVYLPIVLKQQ